MKQTDFPELSNKPVEVILETLKGIEIIKYKGKVSQVHFDIGYTISQHDNPEIPIICSIGESSRQFKKWKITATPFQIEVYRKRYKKDFYWVVEQIKNHDIITYIAGEIAQQSNMTSDYCPF